MSGESTTPNTFDEAQLSPSGDFQKLHRYIELSEGHRGVCPESALVRSEKYVAAEEISIKNISDPTPLSFSVCV